MANETFDPKKPEIDYYNGKPEDHDYELRERIPRRKSIFASKKFIIAYGFFLLSILMIISVYQKGGLNNVPIIKNIIANNTLNIELDNIKYRDSIVTSSIKVRNINYDIDFIEMLIVNIELINDKEVLASNSYKYNNIVFPTNQTIGFNTKFKNEDWLNSKKMNITLYLDNIYKVEKSINIETNL